VGPTVLPRSWWFPAKRNAIIAVDGLKFNASRATQSTQVPKNGQRKHLGKCSKIHASNASAGQSGSCDCSQRVALSALNVALRALFKLRALLEIFRKRLALRALRALRSAGNRPLPLPRTKDGNLTLTFDLDL